MKLLRVRDPKQTGNPTKKRPPRRGLLSARTLLQAPRDHTSQEIVPFSESSMQNTYRGWSASAPRARVPNNQWNSRNGKSSASPVNHAIRPNRSLLRRRRLDPNYNLPTTIQAAGTNLASTSRGCYNNQPSSLQMRYEMTPSVPNYDERGSGVTGEAPRGPTFTQIRGRTAVTTSINNCYNARKSFSTTTCPLRSPTTRQVHQEMEINTKNTAIIDAEPITRKRRRTNEQSSVTGNEKLTQDRLYHVISEAVKRELLSSIEDLAAQTARSVMRDIESQINIRQRPLTDEKYLEDGHLVCHGVGVNRTNHTTGQRSQDTFQKYSPVNQSTISRQSPEINLMPEAFPMSSTDWASRHSTQSSWPSPPSGQDEQLEPLPLVTSRRSPDVVELMSAPPPTQDAPVNLSHRNSMEGTSHQEEEEEDFDTQIYMISPSATSPDSSMSKDYVTSCDLGGFVPMDAANKDGYFAQQTPQRRGSLPGNVTSPEVGWLDGNDREETECEPQQSLSVQEALTPHHLKKAKLMFFYSRYPTTNILKYFFTDVKFTRATTSQLIKWFSNFREFYYIQVEKFARQALTDGITEANQLQVSRDSEVFRILNLHYNKNEDFVVPREFDSAVDQSIKEFLTAIRNGKDRLPSWKKSIYKTICKFDQPVPDVFRSIKFPPSS